MNRNVKTALILAGVGIAGYFIYRAMKAGQLAAPSLITGTTASLGTGNNATSIWNQAGQLTASMGLPSLSA